MTAADTVCAALIRTSINRRRPARVDVVDATAALLLLPGVIGVPRRLLHSRLLGVVTGETLPWWHTGRSLDPAFDGQRRTDGVCVAATTVAGTRFRSDWKLWTDWLLDGEPRGSDDRLYLRTLDEVVGEHGENQVLAILRNPAEIFPREREILLSFQDDPVLELLVEGHRAGDEDVKDDADGPDIGFCRAVLLAG